MIKVKSRNNNIIYEVCFSIVANVFVYGSVALARSKLVKENEPEENP